MPAINTSQLVIRLTIWSRVLFCDFFLDSQAYEFDNFLKIKFPLYYFHSDVYEGLIYSTTLFVLPVVNGLFILTFNYYLPVGYFFLYKKS